MGDHARSVMDPVCPFLNMIPFSQPSIVTNWMSIVNTEEGGLPLREVGAAKTVPSGCHATFDEVSDSTSTAGIIPSIFLRREDSSEVIENT